tara:strand:+ start:78 stop:272 length:195 start_codon:yes stop_codon:yes gene_type:complete
MQVFEKVRMIIHVILLKCNHQHLWIATECELKFKLPFEKIYLPEFRIDCYHLSKFSVRIVLTSI